MSLIRRNTTRTAKNSTETTRETDTPSATTLAFALTASDKFYLAFRKPFACRYFALGTVSDTQRTPVVKYWNGTAFVVVEDLIDQTLGFTQSGFISWVNPGGWKARQAAPFADQELYWIELSVAADLGAATTLQAVLNLFCDEELLRAYYPELVSDSARWYPPGRSNFLEQLVAAKDQIVTRLKQSRVINDESQVIDPNEVAIAAVHATAYIIMAPVVRDDEDRQKVRDIYAELTRELGKLPIAVDNDNSGAISDAEKKEAEVTFRMR